MTELSLPVVWSPQTRLHDPDGGVWVGVRIPDAETAERVDRILEAVRAGGVEPIEASPVNIEDLTSVHDPALIEFLSTCWERWEESGYLEEPGMNRVVAYAWTHPHMRPSPRPPRSVSAWTGQFATDTMTLLGPGSWAAIQAAAGTAVGAADLVAGGGRVAYALARPPGHHAGTSFYGGSCYLNNAALAAARLADRFGRVAIVDVDAHHGNGTQQIFWDRPDVRYGSVHVDPGQGWYPHYVGFADEKGGAEESNRNLPLPPGSGDAVWLQAVEELVSFAGGCAALVVSLGVDAADGDPESPLRITVDGYREAGRLLGGIAVPTVIVQEGGYVPDTIGDLVVAFLDGFRGEHR